MDEFSADPGKPREGIALPRTLAMILFTIAAITPAIVGPPLYSEAVSTDFEWDWRALGALAAVTTFVWIPVWLGWLLWNGRPIPMWFTRAICLGYFVILMVLFVPKYAWMEAMFLPMLPPMLAQYLPAPKPDPKRKPPFSRDFDELSWTR